MSNKNRNRLRPFHDPDLQIRLVQLPLTIQRHLDLQTKETRGKGKGLSAAMVAIDILINTALRINNLRQIHLDRHLIKVGKKTHLVIPGEEVKNGQDLEFELSDETVRLIEWYVEHHRAAPHENRYLFPGRGPAPKDDQTLRSQIQQTVRDYLGIDVNPHLFRHIAVLFYTRKFPGAYETMRQVLGHRGRETLDKAYAGEEGRYARSHFSELIQSLRSELGSGKPGATSNKKSQRLDQ